MTEMKQKLQAEARALLEQGKVDYRLWKIKIQMWARQIIEQ